jgi:myo-inositol 2-dehydrogenase/D-chiro-inositol 1-dehydrogenase
VRAHERYARHGDVDTTAIVLTLDDGTPVTIDGTRHDPRGQDVRVELAGQDDVVVAGLGPRTPLRAVDPGGYTPAGPGWESSYERFAPAHAAETDAFVALVQDRGSSPCPPSAALEALRIADACELSRATGRPVTLR